MHTISSEDVFCRSLRYRTKPLSTLPPSSSSSSPLPTLSLTSLPVLSSHSSPSSPPSSPSHPLLRVLCCVLVKSQLATVSRSLAPLTMASGIMLNAAPLSLHPYRPGTSDAPQSTQEGDRGLLNEDVTAITQAQLTDTLSVCSSSSHVPPPLSSHIPLPHFFFLSFFPLSF